MLRVVVLLLVLANLLVLAWHQSLLAPWLPAPGQAEREPERMNRQVNAELVRVLSPVAASAALAATRITTEAASQPAASASAPASVPGAAPALPPTAASTAAVGAACLEAGPLAAADVAAAEKALREKAPAGLKWVLVGSPRKGNYLVYMGRFADDEALARKIDELKRMKVDTRPMTNWPDLQPGLVLGRFDDKAAAEAALAALTQRGVRTARVVTVTPSVTLSTLRVSPVDAELRGKLEAIQLPPGQIGFVDCAAAPART